MIARACESNQRGNDPRDWGVILRLVLISLRDSISKFHQKLQFPNRRQGRAVELRPPSADPAKWNVRFMESASDVAHDRDQSIFGAMSIPADENAHVQPVREAHFCTILGKPAGPKI
jgi:hypothetical protein